MSYRLPYSVLSLMLLGLHGQIRTVTWLFTPDRCVGASGPIKPRKSVTPTLILMGSQSKSISCHHQPVLLTTVKLIHPLHWSHQACLLRRLKLLRLLALLRLSAAILAFYVNSGKSNVTGKSHAQIVWKPGQNVFQVCPRYRVGGGENFPSRTLPRSSGDMNSCWRNTESGLKMKSLVMAKCRKIETGVQKGRRDWCLLIANTRAMLRSMVHAMLR